MTTVSLLHRKSVDDCSGALRTTLRAARATDGGGGTSKILQTTGPPAPISESRVAGDRGSQAHEDSVVETAACSQISHLFTWKLGWS